MSHVATKRLEVGGLRRMPATLVGGMLARRRAA
jgi:hypothetical protein